MSRVGFVNVTALEDIVGFAAAGPLFARCARHVTNAEEWRSLALHSCKHFGWDATNLTTPQATRILHQYLPVFFWCEQQLLAHQHSHIGQHRPLVFGLSAPQGCGKTTLMDHTQQLFQHRGRVCAVLSLDDLYLTHKNQNSLAARFPQNDLLTTRGNAGTHDLALGVHVLNSLLRCGQGSSRGGRVAVPRYNKSAFGGRGDRLAVEKWPVIAGPVDVILFEGWMLGFKPIQDNQRLAAIHPGLPQVNNFLKRYGDLHKLIDAWLVFQVADPEWVRTWRLEAEHNMIKAGKSGMTDAQVSQFVDRFMPAYRAYLPELYERNPKNETLLESPELLRIEVDASRSMVGLSSNVCARV